mmetsp:Transcript_2417/g.9616  ORF Transcript_2417/g.9616 Transcript_2417/m.9616 type:complete len:332 (+) Transcript_2417:2442-3437(+)
MDVVTAEPTTTSVSTSMATFRPWMASSCVRVSALVATASMTLATQRGRASEPPWPSSSMTKPSARSPPSGLASASSRRIVERARPLDSRARSMAAAASAAPPASASPNRSSSLLPSEPSASSSASLPAPATASGIAQQTCATLKTRARIARARSMPSHSGRVVVACFSTRRMHTIADATDVPSAPASRTIARTRQTMAERAAFFRALGVSALATPASATRASPRTSSAKAPPKRLWLGSSISAAHERRTSATVARDSPSAAATDDAIVTAQPPRARRSGAAPAALLSAAEEGDLSTLELLPLLGRSASRAPSSPPSRAAKSQSRRRLEGPI